MIKYIVLHNTHNGCYDFQYYEDEKARLRLTSITINPPKIFLFNDREAAQDFFEEYINDVDVIDPKCKKENDDVEHVTHCTCGIIELDDDENPILFYNKRNQIFLLENGPQVFMPPQELKNDIKNMNLTNKLIRRCKSLSREQRRRYIELGKYCEDCSSGDFMTDAEVEEEKRKEDKRRREETMKLEYDKKMFEEERKQFEEDKLKIIEDAKIKAEAAAILALSEAVKQKAEEAAKQKAAATNNLVLEEKQPVAAAAPAEKKPRAKKVVTKKATEDK
jgi:hypothetical protein